MKLEDYVSLFKNNPKYLNTINDDDLNDEIILLALASGYNYTYDIEDRFCKSDLYLKKSIEKFGNNFIDILLKSKHFNKDTLSNDINLRLRIVNYVLGKGIIDNEIINDWFKVLLKNDMIECLYYKNDFIYFIPCVEFLNLPNNINEIRCENNNINFINNVTDIVKRSNNNIERIVVDLPENTYTKEELERIKDKNLVKFNSINDITSLSVSDLIELEDILDLMVADINKSNLSPYERYIAVYNIVKSFKEYEYYKENREQDHQNYDQSRYIYLILKNNFIVCRGFSKLLENLLKRVGVGSCSFKVHTNNSDYYHATNYVNLVDEKYGINGYYMCSTTDDNIFEDMMDKGYDYIHLTTKESRALKEYDKRISSDADLNDEMFNDFTDEEMLKFIEDKEKFNYLMSVLSKLDKKFFNEIILIDDNILLSKRINGYFKTKLNNPIDKELMFKGILEVKQFIEGRRYTEEEYGSKWRQFVIEQSQIYNENNNSFSSVDIKKMKISDFYNFLNNKSVNEVSDIFNSIETTTDEYLRSDSDYDNSFLLRMIDNNYNPDLCLCIFFPENLSDESISRLLMKLREKYNCDIVDDCCIFFYLNNLYEYTFLELFEYLKSIKNDYINVYKNVLNEMGGVDENPHKL